MRTDEGKLWFEKRGGGNPLQEKEPSGFLVRKRREKKRGGHASQKKGAKRPKKGGTLKP